MVAKRLSLEALRQGGSNESSCYGLLSVLPAWLEFETLAELFFIAQPGDRRPQTARQLAISACNEPCGRQLEDHSSCSSESA